MRRAVFHLVVVCAVAGRLSAQSEGVHLTVIHNAPEAREVVRSAIAARKTVNPTGDLPTREVTSAETAVKLHNVAGTYGEIITDGLPNPPYHVSGALMRATTGGRPDVGVKLGANTGTFHVFDVNDLSLFKVKANGDVAIGNVSVTAGLAVGVARDGGFASYARHDALIETNAQQWDFGANISAVQSVNAGVVNIGSAIGLFAAGLKAGDGDAYRNVAVHAFGGIESDASGTLANGVGVLVDIAQASGVVTNGFGLFINDLNATNGWGVHQEGANDKNFFRGNVGIGIVPAYPLHVNGNARITGTITIEQDLNVSGNIGAKFQDLAEWVPSSKDLVPGTVVVLDPSLSNHVIASSRPYDTTVAGVVSEKPGIILGEAGVEKEQIATTGRVKVLVDASRGPVRIGDLLVTGDRPGTAMCSQPIDVGGTTMHRPGTIIGKALEPLAAGEKQILVLLSLQ